MYAGAGKVGREAQERGFSPGGFQISQRADFMEAELGVDTMHNRPILNTRDEPHANPQRYRRLHLILGDANMCEYATALKVGTTRVVLDMIAEGFTPSLELVQPVQAIRTLSQDPSLRAVTELRGGGEISGLDIQRQYVEAARKMYSQADEETLWILQEWEEVLEALDTNPESLVGKVDWITKRWLLEAFRQEEGIGWDDPWLASLDLEYHNIDPERGLFMGLEAEGGTSRICEESDIQLAIEQGPVDTRGGIRGLCMKRFGDHVTSSQWERMIFTGDPPIVLELGDQVDPESVVACRKMVESAQTPGEFLQTVPT